MICPIWPQSNTTPPPPHGDSQDNLSRGFHGRCYFKLILSAFCIGGDKIIQEITFLFMKKITMP